MLALIRKGVVYYILPLLGAEGVVIFKLQPVVCTVPEYTKHSVMIDCLR